MTTRYRIDLKLILSIFLLLSTFLFSRIWAQQFGGGLKAGILGTQVDGDGFSGFNKPGIYAGGFVNLRVPFQKDIGLEPVSNLSGAVSPRSRAYSRLQMELAYAQKGSRKNPNYEKEDFEEYLLRTDYAELAILYKLIYSEVLAFEGGMSLGYLLSTFEKHNGSTDLAPVPFRQIVPGYNAGVHYFLNPKTSVNLRLSNAILSLRRDSGQFDGKYRYRFWHYGQFHVALGLILQYSF